MAAVAIAIGYLLLFAMIITPMILFYILVKYRKRLRISIPVAGLLVGVLTVGCFIYQLWKVQHDKDVQPLLGDYTLSRLDGQDCQHCLVHLNDNYQYDILRDGQVVGHGKWWLESAIDIPGKFLQLENGPTGVIWPHIRTIDYIQR